MFEMQLVVFSKNSWKFLSCYFQ